MASKKVMKLVFVVVVLTVTSSLVIASPIEVGSGLNNAGLYIEWSDGYSIEFIVKFEDTTISGLDLFDTVESKTTLTTVRQDYGWGIFIDGITYEGHSNSGYGGGEDWWHYWIKNSGQNWVSPAYGAVDRTLYTGDMDGWVYGSATIPEPMTVAMLALGGLFMRKRRV